MQNPAKGLLHPTLTLTGLLTTHDKISASVAVPTDPKPPFLSTRHFAKHCQLLKQEAVFVSHTEGSISRSQNKSHINQAWPHLGGRDQSTLRARAFFAYVRGKVVPASYFCYLLAHLPFQHQASWLVRNKRRFWSWEISLSLSLSLSLTCAHTHTQQKEHLSSRMEVSCWCTNVKLISYLRSIISPITQWTWRQSREQMKESSSVEGEKKRWNLVLSKTKHGAASLIIANIWIPVNDWQTLLSPPTVSRQVQLFWFVLIRNWDTIMGTLIPYLLPVYPLHGNVRNVTAGISW